MEEFTKFGKFAIAPDQHLHGELRVAGKGTSLYLRDDEFFHTRTIPDKCLTGILHDLTRVTLIECITLEEMAHGGDETYHSAKLFPHFVLEGPQHISPNDQAIVEIRLGLDDATALFYDFDAFGTVIDPVPHIERIAAANKVDREIVVGPEPRIVYFTGKRDIIEVDTALGTVRARHNPGWSLGGPAGVRIDNVITIGIEPERPLTFGDAFFRTLQLLRFLELVIGRRQNLREFVVFVNGAENRVPLRVHWSYRPLRTARAIDHRRSPQPADLLLDPIRQSDEFANVMRAWLGTDRERQDARCRFHTSFIDQEIYSVERLIGAANMFDLLPNSAAPKDVDIPSDVMDAKRRCQEIFESLPDSYERSSVLGILGRLGKASLKHKTRHRAQYVETVTAGRFPDLALVLDEAINCRNHYVHGSSAKIDYRENFDMVTFFTDTLEFVFAASELIEAGWNIQAFIKKGTTMSHPFGAYRVDYDERIKKFHALLSKA
ncbi:MAG: hypothetical protein IH606_20150 [Burkholderiales bacterium]|nr:hypothetical protein [Burkholderiales bacterium]